MTKLFLEDYQKARDRALSRVQRNADDACHEFTQRASECVIGHLARVGEATGEELTDACKAAGIVPHTDKAFGAVIQRLARAGRITKRGFAVRKKGHGTAGAVVWALARPKPCPTCGSTNNAPDSPKCDDCGMDY